MKNSFQGSCALVTGASSGLGEEFARQLAARGANLVLTARSRAKLEVIAGELTQAHGVRVEDVSSDLSEAWGVDELIGNVNSLGVEIDHLVNNAGFGLAGAFVDLDAGEQTRMLRLNCEALLRLSRHFAPKFVEKRAGGIIHVASTAGHQPMPFMATYGATKAFVLSFSVALAEELASANVRVMALCPGPVPTGFQAVAGIEPGMERVAALSAKDTVARGIEAYEAGDFVCVPGAVNRVQTMISKLMPRRIVTHTVGQAMRRMGRAGKGPSE